MLILTKKKITSETIRLSCGFVVNYSDVSGWKLARVYEPDSVCQVALDTVTPLEIAHLLQELIDLDKVDVAKSLKTKWLAASVISMPLGI